MSQCSTFAQRLRSARKKAGLTQAQVSEAVGIKQASYSALESGKAISSRFIVEIAEAISADAHWLICGGEQAGPELNERFARLTSVQQVLVLNIVREFDKT